MRLHYKFSITFYKLLDLHPVGFNLEFLISTLPYSIFFAYTKWHWFKGYAQCDHLLWFNQELEYEMWPSFMILRVWSSESAFYVVIMLLRFRFNVLSSFVQWKHDFVIELQIDSWFFNSFFLPCEWLWWKSGWLMFIF